MRRPEPANYLLGIAAIHRELGIPAAYAAARGLPVCEEAAELVDIGPDINNRERQLAPRAAHHWRRLHAQARQHGISLLVVSAFRSVAYQRDLIIRKLATGQPLDDILKVIAAPGYSEHHTGRALDLTSPDCPPLEQQFETTAAFAWLQAHAGGFGFHLSYPRGNPHGISYEPWHWAFVDS